MTTTLIQISDTHLFQDPKQSFKGQNTHANFLQVLDTIKKNEPHIDAILLTGDLAEDGRVETYQNMQKDLASFSCPIYYLPGNHDNLDNISALQNTQIQAPNQVVFANWECILLNSVVPGEEHGYLAESEMHVLEKALADSQHYKLIALHHHPYPIACKAFANIGLKNREAFWDLLKAHAKVKAVICGHVHQALEMKVDDIDFFTCPATSIQVQAESALLDFKDPAIFDALALPGYRRLQLFADGQIKAQACRVGSSFTSSTL